MKCKKCEEEGKKSNVHIGMCTRTLLGIPPPYYDEEGILHCPPDPNVTTTEYRCSNGHKFIGKSNYVQETFKYYD